MSSSLLKSSDPRVWRGVLSQYDKAINALCSSKAKRKRAGRGSKRKISDEASSDQEFPTLDAWYFNELPRYVTERGVDKERWLTLEEVKKIVKWKLMRGKFRPRLMQLVSSNEPATVIAVTKASNQKLPDIETAIHELTALKGVGPATASAILQALAPGTVPFMSDEAMGALSNLGPISYTEKHYSKFLDQLKKKCQELNRKEFGQNVWTPDLVEKALWIEAICNRFNIEIPKPGLETAEADLADESSAAPIPAEQGMVNTFEKTGLNPPLLSTDPLDINPLDPYSLILAPNSDSGSHVDKKVKLCP
ncbi:uncharacterized protein VTP21DRAFT_5282 [Calcarisporiella thermophila]|uniref:uncharacterized protein n=1 Tax=Calcarisporiella thermophila TaxID=911321 RepID=UPI0037434F9B